MQMKLLIGVCLLGMGSTGATQSQSVRPLARLVHTRTRHFDVYATPGSVAAADLKAIAHSREAALAAVARLFDVPSPEGIRLTLFPDEATKKAATGHAGLGWAEGKAIEEVYNLKTKLDPYHELAHIVGASLGRPPAMIDEGFAVYVSERLGADALALLGHPNTPISTVGCMLVSQGQALPLERLFDLTELGSVTSNGPISYPQSASIVKYLVDTHGLEHFRLAYRRLRSSTLPDIRSANRAAFARLYGTSLPDVEAAWRRSVCDAS
jgi:hypothetical protein